MRKLHSVWALAMLVLALTAWGQDNSQPAPTGDATQQEPSAQQPQPIPAYGDQNAPPPITENPPLSGLDLPSLEPHAAPLSYLQPGATFSETADSNVGNGAGSQSFVSVTRALGSLTLQRLWSHYDLAADYFGGAAYYDQTGLGWKALQQLDLQQKVTWKRGQFAVRDSFSYLPEGNFGGAYGSQGSQGIQSLGSTPFGFFWGGTGLGTYGIAPRIMNVALADVSESLSPKSQVTAVGGYAFTHFYGSDAEGANFIGSSQVSAQAGYDRVLTAHTQVAIVYGYQGFDFSVFGTAFHSSIIQLMYGHRISGRLDLLIAAGPQFTNLSVACTPADFGNPSCTLTATGLTGSIPDFRIGGAGQFRLRYAFPKTRVDLWYQRFLTSGSGLFAGAETDMASVHADRPFTRVWSAFADIGYSRNSRLQQLSGIPGVSCVLPGESSPNPNAPLPACNGVPGTTYEYGFAGGGVHRPFGRNWHGFASYQFNELYFDKSYCGTLSACNRIGNRSVITIGLDWTPRPIRLD
jgi:hypothetical protein